MFFPGAHTRYVSLVSQRPSSRNHCIASPAHVFQVPCDRGDHELPYVVASFDLRFQFFWDDSYSSFSSLYWVDSIFSICCSVRPHAAHHIVQLEWQQLWISAFLSSTISCGSQILVQLVENIPLSYAECAGPLHFAYGHQQSRYHQIVEIGYYL